MIRIGFGISLLFSLTATALPLPRATTVAPLSLSTDYGFEGIVALDDCSGSLIQFENASDSDPALILTNGHCLESGFPEPGKFISNQPSTRSFRLLDNSGDTAATLTAEKVVYSTMTDTDITLYQLKETYQEIKSTYSVRPFTLSSKKGDVNLPIQVISGYWHTGYSCNVEAYVYEVHEGGWVWKDSLRYSRPGCEVIGGTSGSPVIAAGTRTMIAINNTINEDGEQCTFDNPCEVDSHGGIVFKKGYGYAEETDLIYSCLNANHQFDLATKGCQLLH